MVHPLTHCNPNIPKLVTMPSIAVSTNSQAPSSILIVDRNGSKRFMKRKSYGKHAPILPLKEYSIINDVPSNTVTIPSVVGDLDTVSQEEVATVLPKISNAIQEVPLKIKSKINRLNILPRGSTLPTIRPRNIRNSASTSSISNINKRNLPFWSVKSLHRGTSSNINTVKKSSQCKAYQLEPLRDPKLERCRKNAVNAKKNRDIQKQKMEDLLKAMQSMKDENERIAREMDELAMKYSQLQEDHQAVLSCQVTSPLGHQL